MNDTGLRDQVVIVTGAGRGLGRSHAMLLASLGAAVVVNDAGVALDGAAGVTPAMEVVAEIRAAGGHASASDHRIDDPEAAAALVADAVEEWGRVDAIVHNAGILRDATLSKMTHADVEAVLAVHLVGAFNVLRPALEHLRRSDHPRVVLTTSASGLFGTFGQTNYAAGKMGLVGLMNVLALEGERWGLRINCVAPTARTRMTEELLGDLADRLDPEHVSPLVAFLCSSRCDVNREIFAVGGGRYARAFVGIAPGWTSGPGEVATIDTIEANLDAIRSLDGFVVPTSGQSELEFLQAALAADGPGPVTP